MNKNSITLLIVAGLIAAAGNAEAVVRAVPVKIAPLALPSIGMPILPLINAPILPTLPISETPLAPSISLPGVRIPIVQPFPIERPVWPVQSIKLVHPDAMPVQTPESAIEKAIEKVRKAFQFDQDPQIPAGRINIFFDGTKAVKTGAEPVKIPVDSRPSIEQSDRPVTLPEQDLIDEIGIF